MGTVTTTKYICDCCGIESDERDFNNGHECGTADFKLNASIGGMAYNGDWGGVSHKIDDFICFECARTLMNYYQKMKAKK